MIKANQVFAVTEHLLFELDRTQEMYVSCEKRYNLAVEKFERTQKAHTECADALHKMYLDDQKLIVGKDKTIRKHKEVGKKLYRKGFLTGAGLVVVLWLIF